MPFINLLIHATWATKDRKPLLEKPQREAVMAHIRENAVLKNIHLINVNGDTDHLHALIAMRADQNVETVINLLKGEASFWANRNLEFSEHFGWQDEYIAVTVSESHFERVNRYISRQEYLHKTMTFAEEHELFMQAYHFDDLHHHYVAQGPATLKA